MGLNRNNKYTVSTLQIFLNRLYTLTDDYIDGTEAIKNTEEDMKEHGYSQKEINEKTVEMSKNMDVQTAKKLYDDYKRFLSNILIKTQENIENYLRTKGYDLEVAVTLKQFIEPVLLSEQNKYILKPYVYTAFRDSKTWSKGARNEVMGKKYTINKNSDFIHSLSNGYYVFNNKTKESAGDYINENKEFYKYYNCGVTMRVVSPSDKENADCLVYGFLACDVLNDKYENKQIMDTEVVNLLENAACIISIYFDNIDFNWVFCQISDEYKSFWKMVDTRYVKRL